MTYELAFNKKALKEWQKLAPNIQKQFKTALAARLVDPHKPKHRLRGYEAFYKIKLRESGYRLVDKVIDHKLVVLVLVISKRNKNSVYNKLNNRVD